MKPDKNETEPYKNQTDAEFLKSAWKDYIEIKEQDFKNTSLLRPSDKIFILFFLLILFSLLSLHK